MAIAVGGGTVLLIGIVMIFLPGPSILVIPAGLAILAIEFAWARHLLHKFRSYLPKRSVAKDSGTKPETAASELSPLP
jgi:phosphotransferase system  glucose/maltose/N-acetylglucosamine-specific IIC component